MKKLIQYSIALIFTVMLLLPFNVLAQTTYNPATGDNIIIYIIIAVVSIVVLGFIIYLSRKEK